MNGKYVCPPDAGPAWRAAMNYGFDMSLVEDALQLTPEQRLEQHQRALDLIMEVKASKECHAANNKTLLTRLREQKVKFVIIGDVCGVFHGISPVTLKLDICCRFNRENLRRIEAAVEDLHPRHRLTANRLPLELTEQLCNSLKNIYLSTDWGSLDCLSEVAGVGDYEQVLKQSISHRMSHDDFRILNLDALIASKVAAGRETDREAVKLLRAINERNG